MRGAVQDELRLSSGSRRKGQSSVRPFAEFKELMPEAIAHRDRRHRVSLDDKEQIRRYCRGLTVLERLVITLRFCEDMTQREIAQVCGYHATHIHYVLGSAMKEIRAGIEGHECLTAALGTYWSEAQVAV